MSVTQNPQRLRLAIAGERTDESCLADNVYFEAAYEPLDGKLAVAQVTLFAPHSRPRLET